MSKLSWVTPKGNIASLLVGIPADLELIANDNTHNGATLTYTVIGGALPTGMTLSNVDIRPSGSAIPQCIAVISGTPTSTSLTSGILSKETYNFIVRVTSSNTNISPIDEAFTISLSNIVNNNFSWVTKSGSLGTVPNGEFYSLQLLAQTNTNAAVTYSFVSGELPTGMQLLPTGYLQGVPEFLNPVVVDQNQTYRFTVRASTGNNIIDRSFSVTITNVYGPIIEPSTTLLGQYFDGT